MNVGIQASFCKLKPICTNVTNNPSKQNLEDLKAMVSSISKHTVQTLYEYIIFPLFLNLQRNDVRLQNKYEIINALQYLLKEVKLKKLSMFQQLNMVLTLQIYDPKINSIVSVDEEFKLVTIQCINLLYKNLSDDIIMELYTKEYSVTFSQTIFTCVELIKKEKSRELRLDTLECLMAITHVHDQIDFNDIVLQNQIADALLFFLPGICRGLLDAAVGDAKQGHKITMLAVKALTRVIILYMQDDKTIVQNVIVFEFPKKELRNDPKPSNQKLNTEEMKKKIDSEKRTDEWYKITGEHLHNIIESLTPLQHHYHPNVKFELINMCQDILTKCCKNMSSSINSCFKILISLSEDENIEIKNKSITILNLLTVSENIFDKSLVQIIEEDFYEIISKIPRVINGTDTSEQLSSLNLLVGYLRFLGSKNVPRILNSIHILKRLMQCLIHISQLETTNVYIFEEFALRDFESISTVPITWKRFKYIEEKSLQIKLQVICKLLSEPNTFIIIVDYLCDLLLNSSKCNNEVVFLLNNIIFVKTDLEELIPVVDNVLKIYLKEENWYLPLDVDNSSSESVQLIDVHYNIVQVCLLVEGIGIMANSLGESFKQFLMKTLYLVLERAGSPQPTISNAGLLALSNIASACGNKNVTELIVENTDYFSFHVVRRLKRLNENLNVLDVLNIVMRYSTIDVLPSIMDILSGLLIQSLDKYEEHNTVSFLKVFHLFVLSLRRWFNIDDYSENYTVKLLKEYKKSMDFLYVMYGNWEVQEESDKTAEEMFKEDMSKEKEELVNEFNMNEDKYEKPTPPDYINLNVLILKRSLNYLPNKKQSHKLLVLDILTDGLEILREYEDKLLPLIHLIWSPLVDRFKEHSDYLLINKSFKLLITLAKLSKDFIRSRTSKTVFPYLCETLKKLSKESYLKDRGSAYRYTQAYKLQLSILKNLAQLIIDLDMTVVDISLAMDSVFPYLSNKQPLPLQECSGIFYKTLAHFDFDSVWLHLINIWGPPCNDQIINVEYRKNVEIILNKLEKAKW